jgi:hypothetical protein
MLKGIGSACAFAMLVCVSTASAQDRLSDRITANAIVGVGTSRAGVSSDTLATVGVKPLDYMSVNVEVLSLSFRPYNATRDFKKRALDVGGTVRFALEATEHVHTSVTIGLSSAMFKNAAGENVRDFHPTIGIGGEVWPTRYLGVGMNIRSMFVDRGTSHYFIAGILLGKR